MQKTTVLQQVSLKRATDKSPASKVLSLFMIATVSAASAACSLQSSESRRHVPGGNGNTPNGRTTQAVPANPSGTVTSGGSLIYGDRINPWFTVANSNQTKPSWCLKHDAANFGLSLSASSAAIEQALMAWEPVTRVQFQKSAKCSEATDLKFLLGVASTQERNQLASAGFASDATLRQLAGVTIQTQPGLSSKKGNGFIYIAPASGPLAMSAPDVASRPWSRLEGKLLQITLLHELGHVFGLQHNPESAGLMGQRTVEQLLSRTTIEAIEADSVRRQEFDQYFLRLQPAALTTFADVEEFESCANVKCTKIVFTASGVNQLIADVWTAPAFARQLWGTSGYSLEKSARMTLQTTTTKAISMTRENGVESPGILATVETYTGLDGDGNPITVQRTSGQMPRVVSYDGNKITLIID